MKNKLSSFLLTGIVSFGVAFGSLSFVKNHQETAQIAFADTININDYTTADSYHKSKNASALLTELRRLTSPGKAGSYKDLWTTYSTAFVKSDGYIKDYYSCISKFTTKNKDNGSGGKVEGEYYNREHSIPQAWWGGGTSNQGADPYIVIPSDKMINGKRGNMPYGVVASASFSSSGGYSKVGSADSTWGFSGTVFEPNDEVKGDLARNTLYAVAKYSASSSWTAGGGTAIFGGGSSTFGLTNYAIKLLTYWNNLDKPDDWEIGLNNRLAAIQGNKNPFIDHPEYVNTLWGNNSGATKYEEDTSAKLELSKDSLSLFVNGTEKITGRMTDGSAISWSVEDSNIAQISSTTANEITVTGLSAGTTNITLSGRNENGEPLSKTCRVTVTAVALQRIEASKPKTTYKIGEEFVKPNVIAYYNNGTSQNVTSQADFDTSSFNSNEVGEYTIRISFENKSTSYTVKVVKPTPANNGCGGNIATTSALLSGLAALGIAIIIISIFTRNKNKKA